MTYEDGTANAKTTTYAYDKAGNRLTEQEVELATANVLKDLTYDYDEINRLETITDNLDAAHNVTYSYNANGNTLSKTKDSVTTTFKYDIRDQLGEVQQGASVLGRYGYDYDGRRILKIGDDGRVHYTYDQLSVITEADDSNATVSKYDYGLDQLVSLNNVGEGRSFFHLDALRSTVNLSNDAGSTRQSILYDAWGNERDRIGASTNKFTYTGHEIDQETGLIYAKARFFDRSIGRFLTQDMFFGEVNTPPSLHRYIYALANPLVFIDPTGNQSLGELARREKENARRRDDSGQTAVRDATNMGRGKGNRSVVLRAILTPDDQQEIRKNAKKEIEDSAPEASVANEGKDNSSITQKAKNVGKAAWNVIPHAAKAIRQEVESDLHARAGTDEPTELSSYEQSQRAAVEQLAEENPYLEKDELLKSAGQGETGRKVTETGIEITGELVEAGVTLTLEGEAVKVIVLTGGAIVVVAAHRVNTSRRAAFRVAKELGGLPRSARPQSVRTEVLRDQPGNIRNRVYEFVRNDGSTEVRSWPIRRRFEELGN